MGYKKQVALGFGWLSAFKLFAKALSLGKIVILARILAPTDFGIFGLVTVILSLAEIFTETGINPFLIQTKENPKKYLNTAWVISIVRGAIIGVVLVALSLLVSRFYNEPSLLSLLLIASVIPVIKGFINPAEILFQRELQYHKDVYLRVALVITDVVFALIFVTVFKSALALVLSQVVAAGAEVVISHLLIRPRPRLEFKMPQLHEILRFGRWLNISGVFSYLGNNLDDLIIGKIMGTQSLGYYQNAYAMSQSSTAEIGELAAQASFPAYGRIAADLPRLRRAFFMSFAGLAVLLAIPLLLVLAYSQELVLIVLGEKWLPVVPILPWLTAAAYIQALNSYMYPLNIIRSKTKYSAFVTFVYVVLMVVLLAHFTTTYGLVGAGKALFIVRLLIQPIILVALFRVLYKKKL